MLPTNLLLQNRYQILGLIGQGGMGAVYEATDQRLGQPVAIKQIVRGDATAFEREARLLARLRHPALPRVSDHFVEDAGHFLVMELIPGDDLAATLLRRQQPFSLAEVTPWASQLLEVLAYLHSQTPPIIHRDIKPANLKLTSNGKLVLLDFGLAKGKTGETSEPQKSVPGYTLAYAAPEQIRGEGTDARSDLYAVGATLYTLLTGVQPPDALRRALALAHEQRDLPEPAHTQNPAVPFIVAEVLRKAMALMPAERFESAQAMETAWKFANELPATQVPVSQHQQSLPQATGRNEVDISGNEKDNKFKQRRFTTQVVSGGVLLALLVVLTYISYPLWQENAANGGPGQDPLANNLSATTTLTTSTSLREPALAAVTTPTQATLPTETLAPTVAATPPTTKLTPIAPILFTNGADNCQTSEKRTEFPAETAQISAYFDTSGFRNQPATLQWQLMRNGTEYITGTVQIGADHIACIGLGQGQQRLETGYYELILQRNDTAVRSDFFSIGVSATDLPANPILFTDNVTADGEAVNPRDLFAAGTTTIYAAFPLDGLPPGMLPEALDPLSGKYYIYLNVKNIPADSIFGWRWYMDGRLYNSFDNNPYGGEDGYVWLAVTWNNGGIPSGRYQVVILLNGQPVQQGQFTLE